MKFLPVIWRNLMRRKVRTIVTMLSIFVAFLLFGMLMAIRAAFTMGVEVAGAERLMMIHKVSIIQPLPLSYANRIKPVEGVTDLSHGNWFNGIYQDPKNYFASMAVDSESWFRIYKEFTVPAEQMQAWMRDRTGAIIGVKLAERFNWKIGDRIPLISPIYRKRDGSPWEFTIDGIYDSTAKGVDKSQFFFHYRYLEETVRDTFMAGLVSWYVIQVADPASADRLALQLDAQFANSPAETKTATEKAFISDFAKQVGDIGTIMMAITAVVMFFILFVAGNAMAQSIRERTNELGVLKTLGFKDGLILSLVLAESCVIALVGGGLGLALSWLIIAQGDPTGGFLPAFYFPPADVIVGAVIILLLGVGAGLLPAFQASRLKIVDALRRTG
jgi:putative ABC transport system permease protein